MTGNTDMHLLVTDTLTINWPYNGPQGASWVGSGLRHCISVLEASLQTWVRSQAVSASRDRETHEVVHNRPSVFKVRGGFGLAGISLSHRALGTPCGGPGACKLTLVTSWAVFPPTHWCGWLPG